MMIFAINSKLFALSQKESRLRPTKTNRIIEVLAEMWSNSPSCAKFSAA